MEAHKKWYTTVEYYTEDGIMIPLYGKTQTEITKKYQIIKKEKYVEAATRHIHRQYIVRRKAEQGELRFS